VSFRLPPLRADVDMPAEQRTRPSWRTRPRAQSRRPSSRRRRPRSAARPRGAAGASRGQAALRGEPRRAGAGACDDLVCCAGYGLRDVKCTSTAKCIDCP
jgi:hypothetical protein